MRSAFLKAGLATPRTRGDGLPECAATRREDGAMPRPHVFVNHTTETIATLDTNLAPRRRWWERPACRVGRIEGLRSVRPVAIVRPLARRARAPLGRVPLPLGTRTRARVLVRTNASAASKMTERRPTVVGACGGRTRDSPA